MIKENICVCLKNPRTSKKFDTYEELLKWAKKQIEEGKIEIGDDVKIIDEMQMYTTLGTEFFNNLYWFGNGIQDEEEMFDVIRYYKYDSNKIYNGVVGKIIDEYDGKYVIGINSDNPWHKYVYIVIGKSGVKKCVI